jgi:hypothetical protein
MVMSEEFYEGEEWLELPQDSSHLVSTFGRLYDVKQRQILPLVKISPTGRGNPRYGWNIRWTSRGETRRCRQIGAAHAVLQAFEGAGQVPIYKDGCVDNVSLDNLVWSEAA